MPRLQSQSGPQPLSEWGKAADAPLAGATASQVESATSEADRDDAFEWNAKTTAQTQKEAGGKRPILLSARALQALSRREYTHAELRRKLLPYAQSPEALDTVLQKMQSKGFLSDTRAAASLVRQKASRYGATRLRQELLSRGVDLVSAEEALAGIEADEWARAKHVWQAKFGAASMSDLDWQQRQKLQAKQARFMLSRGFAADIVRRLVQSGPESDIE